jgi:hypothetical protein
MRINAGRLPKCSQNAIAVERDVEGVYMRENEESFTL